MNKLLDGNDRVLIDLMKQYQNDNILSRKFTGRGFFTKFNMDDYTSQFSLNGRIDDVMAIFPNTEVYYFILYVTNGKIDTLEGFSTLEDWKYNYEEAEIKYCFDIKRDYELTE